MGRHTGHSNVPGVTRVAPFTVNNAPPPWSWTAVSVRRTSLARRMSGCRRAHTSIRGGRGLAMALGHSHALQKMIASR